MNKEALQELVKSEIKRGFKDNLMETLNSSFIFKYVETLEQENKQLKENRDKAIEYITSEEYFFLNNQKTGSPKEDINNYMKAQDILLQILKGDDK